MNYFLLTLKHKWYVFLACRKMKVSLWQAIIHDLSKFTPSELPHYQRQFFGDKGDPEGYRKAWSHHLDNNPHHWQNWNHLIMPEKYIREMIADWMGAGKAYQNTWDIKPWLTENFHKMKFHLKTEQKLALILKGELGWTEKEISSIGLETIRK